MQRVTWPLLLEVMSAWVGCKFATTKWCIGSWKSKETETGWIEKKTATTISNGFRKTDKINRSLLMTKMI